MFTFGEYLRAQRNKTGLSLNRVATAIDTTGSYLSSVETGRSVPLRNDRIDAVAELLGVSAEELHIRAAADRGRIDLNGLRDVETIREILHLIKSKQSEESAA